MDSNVFQNVELQVNMMMSKIPETNTCLIEIKKPRKGMRSIREENNNAEKARVHKLAPCYNSK